MKERVGRFELDVDVDEQGRVVRAASGGGVLVVDWAGRRGSYSADYGGERWAEGRLTGTWLDMPYGHECDVDEVIALDAWVERTLIDMRGAVFWEKDVRAIFAYVREHTALRRSVGNVGARDWAEKLAATCDDATLAELVQFVVDDAGLLAAVKRGALDAPNRAVLDV